MSARGLRHFAAALSFGFALAAAACGSSSVSTVQPTSPKCQVTPSTSTTSAPASGGAGSITVEATRDCSWAASAGAPWIAITDGSSGQGEGTVAYRVSANPDHAARRGNLTVNDVNVTVNQDAAPCQYALDHTAVTVAAAGGTAAVKVTSLTGCGWTASSNASWLTLASGSASGSGNGTVTVNAAANDGDARNGTLTIAGVTFTVSQPAAVAATPTPTPTPTPAPTPTPSPNPTPTPAPCVFNVSPATVSVDPSGGTSSVAVATAASCSWTAASNASWVTFASPASGTGDGTVALVVAANAAGARTGTVTVAGQTIAVNQAGAATCTYTVEPTSLPIGSAGGNATVTVATSAGCMWTATSNDTFIALTGASSGSGAGSVAVQVASNSGDARTGSIVVAGQTVGVLQAARATACTFEISPTSRNFGAKGGAVTVSVTTGGTCSWSATSDAAWVHVNGGSPGTGSGSVSISVDANKTGSERTGTATVAGLTFSITQRG